MDEAALALVVRENKKSERREKWVLMVEEVKRTCWLAGPMVAVTLSSYMLQVISLMMVGHLGKLYLSSSALAISFAGVSGFSVLEESQRTTLESDSFMEKIKENQEKIKLNKQLPDLVGNTVEMGMASALETLSGQAYGAEQYEKIGTQTYTGIFCLLVVSIPLSVLWIYMEHVLVFLGQDPQISHEAGRFMICLIPALFGYAILQPLIRYYQIQSMISPLVISSCSTLCFHIVVSWLLVYKSGLEYLGGALSMGVSMWLNVAILSLYMIYSSACTRTRAAFSMKIFEGIKEFFLLAIPSALMICLEWWSFELVVLLSGLLPNPQLETSVLSVCLNTIITLYSIPFGLAAAASTRISNELGAGKQDAARLAFFTVMLLIVLDGLVISMGLFASRNVFGYIFSSDEEVVHYLKRMAPFLCLSVVTDSFQGLSVEILHKHKYNGVDHSYVAKYILQPCWSRFFTFFLLRMPVETETTLKSAVQMLVLEKDKIAEGKSGVNVILKDEIEELVTKLEQLQRSSRVERRQVPKCSNFDKKACALQRRLEKTGQNSLNMSNAGVKNKRIDQYSRSLHNTVASGVARGCGWQHIGAYINLGAFYLFGVPIAAALGFWLDLRGEGLWIGVLCGAILQNVMLLVISCCINWEKQATKAKERLFQSESSYLLEDRLS